MELGRGQTVEVATRVTLLEDNPESLDRDSLHALSNRPFTVEEWLLLSADYLVYRTETGVIEHLRQVILESAQRITPEAAREVLQFLIAHADEEKEGIWLPIKGAQARPWVFEGEAAAGLGSKRVPFHYYEIQVGPASLYFLQQPVGHRRAKRDFKQISKALRRPA